MNPKTERKCTKCRETKNTIEHFSISPAGNRSTKCKSCTGIKKKLIACQFCNQPKPRETFIYMPSGKRYQKCGDCRSASLVQRKREPSINRPKEVLRDKHGKILKVDKKLKTDHVANSYEEKRAIKITAEEAKSKNDLREKEMFNQGAKFVKSTNHVRAYVISM